MAEEKIIRAERIALGIFALVIIVFAIYYMDGCNSHQPTPQNSALESKKAVSEYKRKELTDKLNVLQKFDTIYVTRWKSTKAETKVIIDSVIVNAPDTCDPYLRQIENRLFAERQVADSSMAVKDSVNQALRQIAKEDSVQKSILASQLKLANDSIPKVWAVVKKEKRKSAVKWFFYGIGFREAVNQGINLYKSIR